MNIFTIKLKLKEENVQEIKYISIHECMVDPALKALFIDKLVTACSIYCDKKQIFALPMMTWDRLKDQITSNSSTLVCFLYQNI